MVDVWAIDASAGAPSISAQEARLLTVVPFMAGAGASLGVRSGVRPSGSGTDLLVQAQASPNMSVRIQSGSIVLQGAISATQGAYTWVNDTILTRTVATAHATLARTDLVVVRIRDASADTSGGRDGDVIVITGTAGAGVPALPTDATYYTIAQIAVGAAVSSIVTGNITDRRGYTAATGGVIVCTSTTQPTGVPDGQPIWETNAKALRVRDGSGYVRVAPKGRIGGTRYNAGGTVAIAAGVTTTELVIAMSSGTLTLEASRSFEIRARVQLVTSAAGSIVTMRFRETNISGAVRATAYETLAAANFFQTREFVGLYETGGADETKVFVLTAQTNSGTVNFNSGDSSLAVYVEVVDVGPAGSITVV